MVSAPSNYELLDSGGLQKLERFGERVLARPSSLCIWDRRADDKPWRDADAVYEPKAGWRFARAPFDEWWIEVAGVKLRLSPQNSGQIGVFPEHLSYLDTLREHVMRIAAHGEAGVLNLFAYTGLASAVCAGAGASVTHVDLAKRVLDWAAINFEANSVPKERVRFIREDARAFLAKEARRGKRYQIIIADPPAFSRVSDRETWQLEGVMRELIERCVELLDPAGGVIFFSSHYYEFGEMVIANLLRDAFERRGLMNEKLNLEARQLFLPENARIRRVPAGFLVVAAVAS